MNSSQQTSENTSRPKDPENIVRISTRTNVKGVIRYIVELFQTKKFNDVTISGLNQAIAQVVLVSEVVKSKIQELHQVNTIDCLIVNATDNSGKQEVIRRTPKLEIFLSKTEPKSKPYGYQKPYTEEEFKNISSVEGINTDPRNEDEEGDRPQRGYRRGRGRGDRGGYRGEWRGERRGERRGGYRGEWRGERRGERRGGYRGEWRGERRGEGGGYRGEWRGERRGERRGDRGDRGERRGPMEQPRVRQGPIGAPQKKWIIKLNKV